MRYLNMIIRRTRVGKDRWVCLVIPPRKLFHDAVDLLRLAGKHKGSEEIAQGVVQAEADKVKAVEVGVEKGRKERESTADGVNK